MNSISERIAILKTELGVNNVELAKICGVSKQAVGAWIKNGSQPSTEALIALREKRGVSEQWVLYGKGEITIGEQKDDFIDLMIKYSSNLTAEDKEIMIASARHYAAKNLEQKQ